MILKKLGLLFLKKMKKKGIGEWLNTKLSADDRPDYEEKLQWTCANSLGKRHSLRKL
jgi:hypothetical protein